MSESEGFQARLESAIQAKGQFLEEKILPQLKENFRVFQSLFENLFNILLRKALVQEDPYKYEQKISEVTIPAKGDILDLEKADKLSQRLSAYHAQLEFLNTYYQFSLEFIDLQRVQRILGLVQYIKWQHVVETSADATTAVLAETLAKIRPGSDNVSKGIISTSLAQMQSLYRTILSQLKEILEYQKQAYKSMLRQQLLPPVHQMLSRLYGAGPEQAYGKVKSVFSLKMRGKPFFRDLVMELLKEEFAEQAAQYQAHSLITLKIPEEKPAEGRKQPDYKSLLLEAVRLMIPAGGHVQEALRKIVHNQEILHKSEQGLGGRLRAWLQKTFQSPKLSQTVEIRYFDSRTSTSQTESIEMRRFIERVRRKISLFDSLSQAESASFARLSEASEQQIDDFLKKNLGELQLLHRRLQGLNEHFLQGCPSELKEQLKGIKIELSGLKNCIVRANRRRYQSVALKEEQLQLQQLQLQQLGVRSEPE